MQNKYSGPQLSRGKRLDNGEWVEGDVVHDRGSVYIVGDIREYCTPFSDKGNGGFLRSYDFHEIDPDTLCAWTGKYDKKFENNLYAGDMCIAHDLYGGAETSKGVIVFEYGSFTFKSERSVQPLWANWYDVIGNVFDVVEGEG